MRISRIGIALVSVGMAVSLVGCGGKDDATDLPTIGSQSPVPSSSTPVPTATPTVLPTASTQKYGTLTLVLNHTATSVENAQQALRTYDEFERAAHNTLATNVEDPKLAVRSTGAALRDIRDVLREQKTTAVRTGGSITVTVKVAKSAGTLVVLTGCYDQSKSRLVRANGSTYVGPGTKQTPKIQINVVVTNLGGLWSVTEYNLKDGKC